ncbi:hypothetical protein [Aquimarina mytili]|uniref:Uncharacterized protein n=1 Tax=Aquimarina mytili TaxID=874423 RepID=A0A936ZU43_9FLAO|nr:hypothetical protein [Aquimarina mytili]MBL0681938.1 hypothetical protein [Aquimarina mytili]
MKLVFALPSLFIFFCSYSQSNEDALKDIRQKYNTITELHEQDSLEEISLISNCNDNEQINASISFYYHSKELVYIAYSFSEGHSNYNTHYYVWNNHLIFHFSEYASWTWDYECTPADQGFTNEIWTYEEKRIYFDDRTAIKCLVKRYEDKSIDHPNNLSDTTKNEEIDCSQDLTKEIIGSYHKLLSLKDENNPDICNIIGKH